MILQAQNLEGPKFDLMAAALGTYKATFQHDENARRAPLGLGGAIADSSYVT